MKKVMFLLGSVLFVAAMTVSCGGNAEPAETDTIDTTAIVLDEPIEEIVNDTTPVEEEQVATPTKKKATTKKAEPVKVDPTSKEAAKQNAEKTAIPGLTKVGTEGTDARADKKKADEKKAVQANNIQNTSSERKK